MASVLQFTTLLQPLLSALTNGSLVQTNATSFNDTSAPIPFQIPTDLSSLLTFIYSLSALRDWLKLLLFGAALEACRRVYLSSYSSFIDSFFITAHFESDDVVFDWMMFWLSSLPEWRKVREFVVSTTHLGQDDNSTAILEDDESDDGSPSIRKTRNIQCLPSYAATYTIWYKRRWMRITRQKEESRWSYGEKSTLQITLCTRNRAVLDALILEAKKAYMSAREDKIDIFVNQGFSGDWRHIASRPKRPLTSIILDAGVKELILNDARDFMRSKKWYADRGIPFRRGYLLYGAPGSGKTSIIHSLAGELGLDIYVISLSTAGLDDTGLNSLISALPEQCIALMEDIDAAFTHGLTRETVGTELEDPRDAEKRKERLDDPDGSGGKDAQRDRKQGADSTRITLSGLLNALDGVSAQEGRLLFATTNRYSALDPALTRPGRMDLHVEFMLASRYQAKEMFKRFYVPEDEKEGEDADDVDEKGSDSGYSSSSRKEDSTGGPDLIDLSVDSSSSTPAAPAAAVPPNYTGLMHSARAPTLSKRQIERLATQFADTLPDREFSMASLQGYLMSYKIRPVQAVDDVARWVERKTQERGSKMKTETTV